jgi:hypothetical protein
MVNIGGKTWRSKSSGAQANGQGSGEQANAYGWNGNGTHSTAQGAQTIWLEEFPVGIRCNLRVFTVVFFFRLSSSSSRNRDHGM